MAILPHAKEKPMTALRLSRRLFVLSCLALILLVSPISAHDTQKATYGYSADLGAASPLLDVYWRDGVTNAPVMIYVHGGSWTAGSRSDVAAKPEFFTDLGYVFVSLDYRLVPQVTVDDQLADIDAALGWISANIADFGGDAGNLHLQGHSAGAHLVTMAVVRPGANAARLIADGALRSVISNDTLTYDIPRIASNAPGGRLPDPFGLPFGNDPAQWKRYSPFYQIRKGQKYPAFLVMYSGEGAGHIRAGIAQDFASQLRAAGTEASVFDGSKYNHHQIGDLVGTASDISRAIRDFLRDNS